jgi:hypothetical protein
LLDALAALSEDGLVVLEDVVDVDHLDKLNDRMVKDLEILTTHPNVHYK